MELFVNQFDFFFSNDKDKITKIAECLRILKRIPDSKKTGY